MSIIMGFDVSSACTAWGAISLSNHTLSYLDSGFITPPKGEDVIERLAETRDQISDILTEVKPDHVAIEDIIQFMKGSSGAKTIIMLTSFNRMTALAIRDYLGSSPIPYNVTSIRHSLKLSKELPPKETMPSLVSHHLGCPFPYETKLIKKTGEQKILTPSYDKADALAVAIKHAFHLMNKPKTKFK